MQNNFLTLLCVSPGIYEVFYLLCVLFLLELMLSGMIRRFLLGPGLFLLFFQLLYTGALQLWIIPRHKAVLCLSGPPFLQRLFLPLRERFLYGICF